jgi:hypothetical protein
MEVCNGSDEPVLKVPRRPVAVDPSINGKGRYRSLARRERTLEDAGDPAAATTPVAQGVSAPMLTGLSPRRPALMTMIFRNAIRAAAFGVFVGFAALPMARAEPAPPFKPAISDEAATAVSQMGKTLLARDLSITTRTIRVYLNEFGQPLHIFHTMKIVVRRPNRITIESTGDDGKYNLFYDGKAASIFFPDRKEYAVMAASGDIPSALNELADKINVDFPLSGFFTNAPDKALLGDAIAAWQVGTAYIDGVECRHLFFHQKSGIDLELWVEKNNAATPHRLIVTHRLLPGQPSFIAEFTSWNTQAHPSKSEFVFRPPADAKKIKLTSAVAPGTKGSK